MLVLLRKDNRWTRRKTLVQGDSQQQTQSTSTSFAVFLSSASLVVGKNDPGCPWSRDQNLGCKKNMLGGMGGRVFRLLLWQTLWLSNPREVARHYQLYRSSKSNFADIVCWIIPAVSKIWRTVFHKEIRQPNGAQTLRRLTDVKCHVQNRSETSRSFSWIFEIGGNLFSSL